METTLADANVKVKRLIVSQMLKLRCNQAMDMHAVRRRNLRAEIERRYGGSVAEFGRRTGIVESRLSQLLSETYREGKNFGEKAARTVEAAAGLAPLSLDQVNDLGQNDSENQQNNVPGGYTRVIPFEHNDQSQIQIRKVKLRLSAGITGFSVEPEETDGNPISFRKEWFFSHGYRPEMLIAIGVKGDSMEPTMSQGDTVVINTADKTLKDGKIFAINYEGEAVIKRVERNIGQWWLVSDNLDQRQYPKKICAGDACIIIGRVVVLQRENF
jgi:phage repressor protein C with HTH and peptisase S24 domain